MKLSDEPLFTAGQVRARVRDLARKLEQHLPPQDVVALVVLKGGLHFGSDLLRELNLPLTVDFIRARSYDGTVSQGAVEFLVLPTADLRGKHVLVIEDVLDTGITAHAILGKVHALDPAAVSLCALFDKPARRATDVHADFAGFTVEDRFLVGYGMDYQERYRELPDVYTLE